MKRLKYVLIFLTIISILLSSCSQLKLDDFFNPNSSPYPNKNERSPTSTSKSTSNSISTESLLSAKSIFNDQGQSLYEDICGVIEKQETFLVLKQNVSVDNVKKIIESIMVDKPEYFWLENYSWYTVNDSKSVEKIELKYNCSFEERQQKQKAIDDYYKQFSEGITENMSSFEKLKYTHDFIITNTNYDLNSVDSQNICSVIIFRKSVCAGYAKSLQYLLTKLGIHCAYVSGEAIGRGSHAWNIVEIENEYYYIDVTWDDPSFGGEQEQDYISYSYFCVTTNEIEKTHKAIDNIIQFPICTAIEYNYFVRENLYFDDLSNGLLEDLKVKIDESINNGNSFFASKYGSQSLMEKALEEIVNFDTFIGKTMNYTQDKDNYVLVIFLK